LPDFHPLTVIRDWGNGQAFRLSDAQTGVCVFGATGSGKTSGVAKHLALGYLANGFGGIVLCAKKEERYQWEEWASAVGRKDDLVIFDTSGRWRFNFLECEANRMGGGGLAINIVALLDEISSAIAGGAAKDDKGGDNKFFDEALHHMNMNLVDLPIFAELPLTLPLLRSIVTTAPNSLKEVHDHDWQRDSTCYAIIREAETKLKGAPQEVKDDFEECANYWLKEYPALAERTRSIITLSFSMLVRPFLTRPLRKLFSTDTNIMPEDAFDDGKIIIVDLPIQDYRLAGRVANLAWKYCFQVSVLTRMKFQSGYLRPVFLWADEAQNFVTDFDAEYQAVARSAGGCTVYLTQNRESYRRVLGNDDAVDSLLGNLQAKFFCQNSGDTNEWASKLLGERWVQISSTNVGNSTNDRGASNSANVSRNEQRRYFIEPSTFTTLRRGGDAYNFMIDAIVYKGGHVFEDGSPFKHLIFNQKG